MTTRGQFNTKNPTIKRILKEATELASPPSPDYHAEPLDDNLFEWHFTIRGPPAPSPYAGGLYHGRILLPAAYPLRPPSFRFLTPSGRFEPNREICLSISGHHEESWQPAWGIRTALVAIRSFMDTDAKGQVGGIDSTEAVRRRLAGEAGKWACGVCGRANAEIMREREELAREMEGERKEEEVPEELRLAYREDLAKEEEKAKASSSASAGEAAAADADTSATPADASAEQPPQREAPPQPPAPVPPRAAPGAPAVPAPTRTVAAAPTTTRAAPFAPLQRHEQRLADQGIPSWIDKAIYGVLGALAFMILRKFF